MYSKNTLSLSPDTNKHILLGQGSIYKNWGMADEALVGAVSNGVELNIKYSFWNCKVGGTPYNDHIKGLQFLKSIECSLKASFLDVTADMLKMVLLGDVTANQNIKDPYSSQNLFGPYTDIAPAQEVTIDKYISNITYVGQISGKTDPVVVILENVLPTSGLDLKTKDASDNLIPVTFEAFADIDENGKYIKPFHIYFPETDISDITSVSVSPAAATVAKGATQQFSATVTGDNPDTSVTWSITGNNSTSTTISNSGLLNIDLSETANIITVNATSKVDNTKIGSATVTVTSA